MTALDDTDGTTDVGFNDEIKIEDGALDEEVIGIELGPA